MRPLYEGDSCPGSRAQKLNYSSSSPKFKMGSTPPEILLNILKRLDLKVIFNFSFWFQEKCEV